MTADVSAVIVSILSGSRELEPRFAARLLAAVTGRLHRAEDLLPLTRGGPRRMRIDAAGQVQPLAADDSARALISIVLLGDAPAEELASIVATDLAPVVALAHTLPVSHCAAALSQFEERVLKRNAHLYRWFDLSDGPASSPHVTWPAEFLPRRLAIETATGKAPDKVGFFPHDSVADYVNRDRHGATAEAEACLVVLDAPWCAHEAPRPRLPTFRRAEPSATRDSEDARRRFCTAIANVRASRPHPLVIDLCGRALEEIHPEIREAIGQDRVVWLSSWRPCSILQGVTVSDRQQASLAVELDRFHPAPGNDGLAEDGVATAVAAAQVLLEGQQRCHVLRKPRSAAEAVEELAKNVELRLEQLDTALNRALMEAIHFGNLAGPMVHGLRGKEIVRMSDPQKVGRVDRTLAQEKDIDLSGSALDAISRRMHWCMSGHALAHVTLVRLYWIRFLAPRLQTEISHALGSAHYQPGLPSFDPLIEGFRDINQQVIRDHLKLPKAQRTPVRWHRKKILGRFRSIPRLLGKAAGWLVIILTAVGVANKTSGPAPAEDAANKAGEASAAQVSQSGRAGPVEILKGLWDEKDRWFEDGLVLGLLGIAALAAGMFVTYQIYAALNSIRLEQRAQRQKLREELYSNVQNHLKDIANAWKAFMEQQRTFYLRRLRGELREQVERQLMLIANSHSDKGAEIQSRLDGLTQYVRTREDGDKRRAKGQAEAAKAVIGVMKPLLKGTILEERA